MLLLPKQGVPKELLYVAASVVRKERWRFNYGRKITPDRIAGFPLPSGEEVLRLVRHHVESAQAVKRVALDQAKDDYDSAITQERLDEMKSHPETVLQEAALEERLKRWQS